MAEFQIKHREVQIKYREKGSRASGALYAALVRIAPPVNRAGQHRDMK